MHRFASVRLSLDQNSLDNNSYLDNYVSRATKFGRRATKFGIVIHHYNRP